MLQRLVMAMLMLTIATVNAQENNLPPTGFRALFDGKSLEGWHGMATYDLRKLANLSQEERDEKYAKDLKSLKAHWRVENGELINDGQGTYMTTNDDFGDIELWVDYKTVARADSGIYLRGTPQVQIWDFTDEDKFKIGANRGSGGLWNNPAGSAGKDPLVLADKPFGEWNRFRIVQVGSRTTVYLNNKLVVDNAIMDNYWSRGRPLFAKGPIQLQTHGGEIRWRNIFVREIKEEEAIKILRGKAPAGFQPVFNGKNLDGWAGAVDNYQVKDGSIMCKPRKGGALYTKETYDDFVVRLDFKLPPSGNNGLAIRYPGTGDPAYSGMCELQVLDSEHRNYAKLDARQYHGSAYGMVAATRGYLRPAGKWNYQEVTVKGSAVKVELNGNVILNTDLGKVFDYLGKKAHPGKDLESGHFGFAGHGDPVQFRNVSIKRLK